YKYILIIVNMLIKIQYFIPVEGLLIGELVEKFIDRIYTLYSLLNTIIFNRSI
ncbi:hypothetical protein NEUTE2DRAFT_68127, partial [Neurospora tetrasperma FGSC 2509]